MEGYSTIKKTMGFIKSFLKKIIPSKLKDLYTLISNKSFLHHSIKSTINPSESISDFFIWSSDFKSIEFIAENTNAILNAKEENIEHIFKFYSPNGKFLVEKKIKSINFFSRIKLTPLLDFNKYKYISFTHHTSKEKSIDQILKTNGINSKSKVSNHHRGYTIYYTKNSKVGCAVHGNFGGITDNEKKISIQRRKFVYTPIYKFEKNSKYHLVFNNPTSIDLIIKAYTLDNKKIKTISIPSMGNNFLVLNRYSGGVSFESKMPICRPLIFKNPPPSTLDFDVLHS